MTALYGVSFFMNLKERVCAVYRVLRNGGASHNGAVAVIANLYSESGVCADRVEGLWVQRMDEKKRFEVTWKRPVYKFYTENDATFKWLIMSGVMDLDEFLYPLGGKQYGFGLAQWTSCGRKRRLVEYCGGLHNIFDFEKQCEFLLKELKESYASVWGYVVSNASTGAICDVVLQKYESPANWELHRSTRRKYCKEVEALIAIDVEISGGESCILLEIR